MLLVGTLLTALFIYLPMQLVKTEVNSKVFAQQPGTSGVLFTEYTLFSSQEVAKGACASRCLRNALCLSFTFTGVVQPGNCQGHSKIMTFSDVKVAEVGAQTYAVREAEEWWEKSCSTAADCGINAYVICRRNVCVCPPGHYVSEGLNQCVSDCPVSSLTPNFVQYHEAGIAGHNIVDVDGDAATCMEACVQSTSFYCLNFEYYLSETRCPLGDATEVNYPGIWIENDPGWILYQRNCQ
ncbi:uncharacterized protein [Littorina saxatilis]|uniref:Apple domain-containing protein n=1 Tax=Littorina saxatilis TaxID=31220 RepID=A0AAN9BLF2_9CAEN